MAAKKRTKKKPVKRTTKKKAGRPKTTVAQKLDKKKFDLKVIEELAMLGLTDVQLGQVLSVDERTITRWKKDKAFVSVLKKGKMVADAEMIKSLYKSGIGFEYDEVRKEGASIKDIDVISKVTKTTKYFPPVPASCIFWLKNRQGWVDKQEFAMEDVTINIKLVE